MLGRVFKAYDIRGTYPDLLTDQMAWQIGCGVARYLKADAAAAGDTTPMMRNIVVGRDMRTSSPTLRDELVRGITDFGCDVIDIGLVDTPMVYFAINHLDCGGGVMVTASHNPPKYNGFKVAKRKAKPVGEATGLADIRKFAATSDRTSLPPGPTGRVEQRDMWEAYKKHVRRFLNTGGAAIKVVIDASNGMAGAMVPRLFGRKGSDVEGLTIVEMNFEHKGEFVHPPNPLEPENLAALREAVVREHADFGACFDGDGDRLVVVDEKGGIVGCDQLTALMARHALASREGAAVVYDLRSTRALPEEILAAGGRPVRCRVGHVFMKEAMARENGVFGGELSGHFYFRENFNADSGAIALAQVLSIVARSRRKLSTLMRPIARYAQSGEINFEVEDKDGVLESLRTGFAVKGATVDDLDGVTIDAFQAEGWWFNVRKSNTEPYLRFNAEARDKATLDRLVARVRPIMMPPPEQP